MADKVVACGKLNCHDSFQKMKFKRNEIKSVFFNYKVKEFYFREIVKLPFLSLFLLLYNSYGLLTRDSNFALG